MPCNSHLNNSPNENSVLLAYPDSGHGSLFQFSESFKHQATAFLDSISPMAPY